MFNELFNQFDSFFEGSKDNFFKTVSTTHVANTSPRTRLTEEGLKVELDIPGHNKTNTRVEATALGLGITLFDGYGHVKSSRNFKVDHQKYDAPSMKAKIEDGVLFLTVPLKEKSKTKSSIEIKID